MVNQSWQDYEFDETDLLAEIRETGCTIRSCILSTTGEIQIAKVYDLVYIKNAKRYINQGDSMICIDRLTEVETEIQILKTICHKNCIRLETTFTTNKAQVLIFSNAGTPIMRLSSQGSSYTASSVSVDIFLCACNILSALDYLHNQLGIVHRDVKPDNILFIDGVYRLSDFGSARKSSTGQLTESPGTIGFYPPEICSENSPSEYCGFKADLWALGLVLYICYFGALPYVLRNPNSVIELIELISSWSVEGIVFPGRIEPVLKSLLNRDPTKRHYSKQMALTTIATTE